MAEELAGAAETVAEVGCLESLGLAACCGTCCSCCLGDGSASEAAEFGCLTCCIECLGCAVCCRMVCGACCCCCSGGGKEAEVPEGYAPLAAPGQAVMGGP